ncbi:hypothetical protein SDC9_91986 [bioreactor metagenome]|uniref:Uncharacterized protein n=1 Tax=bioreactor metagenome TaxID=1076179 RepID=A0A644ZWF4_9ZZZZ
MEGERDAAAGGLGPDFPGGLLPHVHALSALVLIGVQPQPGQPGGRVGRGPAHKGKGVGIARRAEQRPHRSASAFEPKGLRPFASCRKGSSTAYRTYRPGLPARRMGRTSSTGMPAFLAPSTSVNT